jgi:branched-chain amino acid transport system substrate-binding protein
MAMKPSSEQLSDSQDPYELSDAENENEPFRAAPGRALSERWVHDAVVRLGVQEVPELPPDRRPFIAVLLIGLVLFAAISVDVGMTFVPRGSVTAAIPAEASPAEVPPPPQPAAPPPLLAEAPPPPAAPSFAQAKPAVAAAPQIPLQVPPQAASPSPSVAAVETNGNIQPTNVVQAGNLVQGVTDTEIRFGMVSPFSGPAKEMGHQLKLGVETAFAIANDDGGINGRHLKLVTADDGYEPTRTLGAMKDLFEKEQVFGFVENYGSPTAMVSVPYALEHHALFFGAFSGVKALRHDPPDRYVFNYRAGYAEEADAVVRYLVRVRRLRPEEIAVLTQQDAYGDAGMEGVAKAIGAVRGGNPGPIFRMTYNRNTVNVDDAVAQLRRRRAQIKAVVLAATFRPAAKFIEKTRDAYPDMIYAAISGVGSTGLSDELTLLGPRFANGVIVSQIAPAVEGYASVSLTYKKALAKYFPGEAPDYASLESYLTANILIEGLRRAGPQLDTETLVTTLEHLRDFDMGLGPQVSFGPAEHQAVHKVWGTQLDQAGHYHAIELE